MPAMLRALSAAAPTTALLLDEVGVAQVRGRDLLGEVGHGAGEDEGGLGCDEGFVRVFGFFGFETWLADHFLGARDRLLVAVLCSKWLGL